MNASGRQCPVFSGRRVPDPGSGSLMNTEAAVRRTEWRRQVRSGRIAWSGHWLRVALPVAGAALAVALHLAPGPAHATTYKWVDEHGVTQYTDRMPPEAVNKGSIELSKEGVRVKKTEAALTPEQRRAKAAEEERQKQITKEQTEISRRDDALLASYTSESEIDLARTRSLRTIDSIVQTSQAYGEKLSKRKTAIEARKATEFRDQPLPVTLERELENINIELARQAGITAQKQQETMAINAKYDADKQRWRELISARGGGPATDAATAKAKAGAPPAAGATTDARATPRK
jgi:uncharacterized protein DUF4124